MTVHTLPTPPTETQCQQYLSCYWPDLNQTLKAGSWDQQQQDNYNNNNNNNINNISSNDLILTKLKRQASVINNNNINNNWMNNNNKNINNKNSNNISSFTDLILNQL